MLPSDKFTLPIRVKTTLAIILDGTPAEQKEGWLVAFNPQRGVVVLDGETKFREIEFGFIELAGSAFSSKK